MKSDEGIFKMLSKSSIIRNQYENVIPINLKQKFKKGSSYCPFFLPYTKICNEVCNECSMKFLELKKNPRKFNFEGFKFSM